MAPRSDATIVALLETEVSAWPQTIQELSRWIRLGEDLIDDLCIDIGAAETNGQDDDALSRLRERFSVVSENLIALRERRQGQKSGKSAQRPLPPPADGDQVAKRTRSAAAKGSQMPSPAPVAPTANNTRSTTAKGAKKRGTLEAEGGDVASKRPKVEEPPSSGMTLPPGSSLSANGVSEAAQSPPEPRAPNSLAVDNPTGRPEPPLNSLVEPKSLVEPPPNSLVEHPPISLAKPPPSSLVEPPPISLATNDPIGPLPSSSQSVAANNRPGRLQAPPKSLAPKSPVVVDVPLIDVNLHKPQLAISTSDSLAKSPVFIDLTIDTPPGSPTTGASHGATVMRREPTIKQEASTNPADVESLWDMDVASEDDAHKDDNDVGKSSDQVQASDSKDHPLKQEALTNPADMENHSELDARSDDNADKDDNDVGKSSDQVQASSSKHHPLKQEALTNPADMKNLLELDARSDDDADKDDNDVGKSSDQVQASGSKHHPSIYGNLNIHQRNAVHQEAQDDMQAFLSFNLPLSPISRNWGRHGQPVLAEAAYHSMKLAASVMILSNGRTVCPYHCIHKEPKAADADTAKPTKVTGVPYPPVKKALRQPSYLERPMCVGSDGSLKPPKPNSYNRNFTLERVLEFYIQEPGGVLRMHCGCVLDDVLIDFTFWKRMVIQSSSTELVQPMDSPLRPRNRLFLTTILDHLHFNLQHIYHYDIEGNRVTREDQLVSWMNGIQGELNQRRIKHGKKLNERVTAKKPLEYVEIPDVQLGGRGRKGKVTDLDVRHYDLSEGHDSKGKGVAAEDLYSDSDSDDSETVRSPASLVRRLPKSDVEHEH